MLPLPLVSVVMPARNASPYVGEAIESTLRQTFTDFELIVADDASDDDTCRLVRSFADPRIRLIRHTQPDYIGHLNAAMDMAKGQFVARMDADDVMEATRLQKQVDYLTAHPDADIVGSWFTAFGERSYVCQTLLTHEEIVSALLVFNPICHPTVMLRRRCVEAMQKDRGEVYDRRFAYAEDYRLWCDLATRGFRLANLPESLLRYRTSATQLTRSRSREMRELALHIRLDYFRHVQETMATHFPDYTDALNALIKLHNGGRMKLVALLDATRLVYHQALVHAAPSRP